MKQIEGIVIRPVSLDDLEWMYRLQLDPDSNRMAGTYPRERDDFFNHWEKVCKDPEVTVHVILVGEVEVGCVAAFPRDGDTHVAYWITPERWGQGIATAALRKLLGEVPMRPLYATVADTNLASLRVLRKCGFQRLGTRQVGECSRYPAHTEELLILTG